MRDLSRGFGTDHRANSAAGLSALLRRVSADKSRSGGRRRAGVLRVGRRGRQVSADEFSESGRGGAGCGWVGSDADRAGVPQSERHGADKLARGECRSAVDSHRIESNIGVIFSRFTLDSSGPFVGLIELHGIA